MTDKQVMEKLLDSRMFIERFLSIVDKQRNKVPFLFNPPQSNYYENRTHFDLILKARKEGMSSLVEALWLHACIFKKNTRAVILSQDLDSTKRHFKRVKYYLENMGDEITKFHVELNEDSQKQIEFPNTDSSFWIGTAGAKTFGRGDDITHCHVSEAAHFANQEVLTAVFEACVPDAYRVIETTANGVGEEFCNLWREAKKPKTESIWKPHFFAWFDDPTNRSRIPGGSIHLTPLEKKMMEDYPIDREQIYWYRRHKAGMVDKALMVQENPSNDREAFLSSGRHVFTLMKLDEKKLNVNDVQGTGDLMDDKKDIRFVPDEEGPLRIWKHPRQNRSYLVVGDVSEGVPDGNWSVVHVLDRSSWEQVAVLRLRINPGALGRKMVDLGYYYNNAVLVPELNNNGWATIEAIKNEGYKHLLSTNELWPNEPVKDGFPTNSKTRSWIITALRLAVDEDTLYFNDPITLGEMETFVQNEGTGKFEAQKGCWDDCVISIAIGAYCLTHLNLDETYAQRSRLQENRPIVVQNVIRNRNRRRRAA